MAPKIMKYLGHKYNKVSAASSCRQLQNIDERNLKRTK